MVGGVFSQSLGATGNPAAENTKHDARNSQNHEDKENRLGFIEVEQFAHPSDHRGEKLTDLGKQSSDNRSSALKSSSFHKNIYGTCHGRSRRTNKEKTAAKTMK